MRAEPRALSSPTAKPVHQEFKNVQSEKTQAQPVSPWFLPAETALRPVRQIIAAERRNGIAWKHEERKEQERG
jgi:hypothetical protein